MASWREEALVQEKEEEEESIDWCDCDEARGGECRMPNVEGGGAFLASADTVRVAALECCVEGDDVGTEAVED